MDFEQCLMDFHHVVTAFLADAPDGHPRDAERSRRPSDAETAALARRALEGALRAFWQGWFGDETSGPTLEQVESFYATHPAELAELQLALTAGAGSGPLAP